MPIININTSSDYGNILANFKTFLNIKGLKLIPSTEKIRLGCQIYYKQLLC